MSSGLFPGAVTLFEISVKVAQIACLCISGGWCDFAGFAGGVGINDRDGEPAVTLEIKNVCGKTCRFRSAGDKRCANTESICKKNGASVCGPNSQTRQARNRNSELLESRSC
jgi:hypothetical protein